MDGLESFGGFGNSFLSEAEMARQGHFNLVVDLKTTNRKFEDALLPLELRYLVTQCIGKRDSLGFVTKLSSFPTSTVMNRVGCWPHGIRTKSGNALARVIQSRQRLTVSLRYDCAYMIEPPDDSRGSLLWELNVFTKVWRLVRRLGYTPVPTMCFDVIRFGDKLRVAVVDDGGKNVYVWDGLGEKRTIECTGVSADLYKIWFVTPDVVVATTAPNDKYDELVLCHVGANASRFDKNKIAWTR
ncbi:hypothetical protein FOZ63_021273 [Perkinsus olseni]|uniref:Uncharacterized protein n=1 Tax=Perkinsus olseni TaxID=32597 RepID=A0A7J6T2M4_PEROL|nr:hypothetical protein FOZ63_021273 [Perkinsus olseni]